MENLSASPTPVIQLGLAEQASAESVAGVTPSPAPFQFVLPQPGAEPISGWRPPLYSIPWAKTSNDHFYFARPIAADQVNWPIADYRYGGVFFAGVVHTGVDIDADLGAPIMAAAPGKVVWVGWGLFTETPGNVEDPYGIAVAIEHDFGYKDQRLYTVYAHMNATNATLSQRVETGDVIGYVGATGATTGPHTSILKCGLAGTHFKIPTTQNFGSLRRKAGAYWLGMCWTIKAKFCRMPRCG